MRPVCFVCRVGVWCGVVDEMLWLAYDDGGPSPIVVREEGGKGRRQGGSEGGIEKESCLNNTSLFFLLVLVVLPPIHDDPASHSHALVRRASRVQARRTPRWIPLSRSKPTPCSPHSSHPHRPLTPSLFPLSCLPSPYENMPSKGHAGEGGEPGESALVCCVAFPSPSGRRRQIVSSFDFQK